MIVPHELIPEETLQNLLTEFVNQDVSDTEFAAHVPEQKIAKVKAALQAKQIFICFDEETESFSLRSKEEIAAYNDVNLDQTD